MNSLILVAKTPIVIQIFTLICKKLSIKLDILENTQIDHKVDLIIVEKDLIDDRFNILKSYSKRIGAISNGELPFEMANDFLIPIPFLPSVLQNIVEEQLSIIKKKENTKTYISNIEPANDINEYQNTNIQDEIEPAINYLENLATDIADDINDDIDDSIVSISSIQNGGILDTNELSLLENLINNNNNNQQQIFDENINTIENKEENWHDLASIIDDAINEVNTTNDLYNKFDNKPIKLLLNNYSLTELTPLLNLLDQDIINTLTDGYEINIQLKLGATND